MLKYWFKPKFGEFDVLLWVSVTASIQYVGWWAVLLAFLGLVVTAWGHSAWGKRDA